LQLLTRTTSRFSLCQPVAPEDSIPGLPSLWRTQSEGAGGIHPTSVARRSGRHRL
jgi:hypothetical protein